jgi:hypothetical protein
MNIRRSMLPIFLSPENRYRPPQKLSILVLNTFQLCPIVPASIFLSRDAGHPDIAGMSLTGQQRRALQ